MEEKEYIKASVGLFVGMVLLVGVFLQYGRKSIQNLRKNKRVLPRPPWPSFGLGGIEWGVVGILLGLFLYLFYLLIPKLAQFVSLTNVLILFGLGIAWQTYASFAPKSVALAMGLTLISSVVIGLDTYWIFNQKAGAVFRLLNLCLAILGSWGLYHQYHSFLPNFSGWNLALFIYFFLLLLFYFIHPLGLANKYIGTSLFLVLFLLGYLAIQAQMLHPQQNNMLTLLGILVGLGVIVGMFAYLMQRKSNLIQYAIAMVGLVLLYKLIQNVSSPILQGFLSAVFWIPCVLVWLVEAVLKGLHLDTVPWSQNLSFLFFLILEIVLILFATTLTPLPPIFGGGGLVSFEGTSLPLSLETRLLLPEKLTARGQSLATSVLQKVEFAYQIYLEASTKQNQTYYSIWKIGEEANLSCNERGEMQFQVNDQVLPFPRGKVVALQRWVPMRFCFQSGILDIFMDGKLIYSFPNVLLRSPLLMQALVVGQSGGLAGKVRELSLSSPE